MKKFSLFLTICMAFVLASCAKEEFPVEQQTSNTRIVKMYQAKDGKLIYLGCREMSADEPFIKPMTTKSLNGGHFQGHLGASYNQFVSEDMDLDPRASYIVALALTGTIGDCSVIVEQSSGVVQVRNLRDEMAFVFVDNYSDELDYCRIIFSPTGMSGTCFYDVTRNGSL